MSNRILKAQLAHAKSIFLSQDAIKAFFHCALENHLKDETREGFVTLAQGFVGVKHGNKAQMIPFSFTNALELKRVVKTISSFKCSELGISFAKAYNHYGTDNSNTEVVPSTSN